MLSAIQTCHDAQNHQDHKRTTENHSQQKATLRPKLDLDPNLNPNLNHQDLELHRTDKITINRLVHPRHSLLNPSLSLLSLLRVNHHLRLNPSLKPNRHHNHRVVALFALLSSLKALHN